MSKRETKQLGPQQGDAVLLYLRDSDGVFGSPIDARVVQSREDGNLQVQWMEGRRFSVPWLEGGTKIPKDAECYCTAEGVQVQHPESPKPDPTDAPGSDAGSDASDERESPEPDEAPANTEGQEAETQTE